MNSISIFQAEANRLYAEVVRRRRDGSSIRCFMDALNALELYERTHGVTAQ